MQYVFIVLVLLSLLSCNKPINKTDTDISNDADFDDINNIDNESGDMQDNFSDSDFSEADELPDQDFEEESCLPTKLGDDYLCFSPRPTGKKCNLLSSEDFGIDRIVKSVSAPDYLSVTVDINDKYYFYNYGSLEAGNTVYRCNKTSGYEEKIINNSPEQSDLAIIYKLSVDKDLIVITYFDKKALGDEDEKCYLGNMSGDWELKQINNFSNDCHDAQIIWPYVVYREQYPGWLHIYDIRTGTEKKLEGYKVSSFHHDGKKAYINSIVGKGDESVCGDIFSQGKFYPSIWEVDLKTLNVLPIEVFVRKSTFGPYVYGSYLVYNSQREWMLYSGDFASRNGMAIVLYDIVNRTEKILTDTITDNKGRAFINYPYAGWVDGDVAGATDGLQKVVNLETEDEWILSNGIKDMRDPSVMKGYNYFYFASVNDGDEYADYAAFSAKFPDPGKVESNESCYDVNPCTDDIYSVKLQKCTNPPNMKKCDDGDPDTPLDICTGGKCEGYQTVADAAEMINIPAGAYYIGDYAPPIENVDPDERPWEGWKNTPPELTLPEYSIDKYEVVQKDYRECVDAGICRAPVKNRSGWRFDYWGNSEYDNYPVLYVDYYEAQKYCLWRGKRLPTEHEWVKAANGGEKKWYPWGDDDPDSENRYGNIFYSLNETTSYDTAEVGTYPKDISPYGVMDMNGNVSEWTSSDWTDYLDTEPVYGDSIKVVKGGRWEETSNYSGWISQRMGATPWTSSNSVGFRCVKSVK